MVVVDRFKLDGFVVEPLVLEGGDGRVSGEVVADDAESVVNVSVYPDGVESFLLCNPCVVAALPGNFFDDDWYGADGGG